MDHQHARALVLGLKERPAMIPVDTDYFTKILENVRMPESSRFYETVGSNKQRHEDGEDFYVLSIRRVLRNRNAKNYTYTPWKQLMDTFLERIGSYSSDRLTRLLRTDEELELRLEQAPSPWSLLGKLVTYYGSGETVSRPILYIPGANLDWVLAWEAEHTIRSI